MQIVDDDIAQLHDTRDEFDEPTDAEFRGAALAGAVAILVLSGISLLCLWVLIELCI